MSRPSTSRHYFFQGQAVHMMLLMVLLSAAIWFADFPQLRERSLFGIGGHVWFVISIAVPVVHQVYVWLVWRGQLCFGEVTRWFGSRDFLVYEVNFLILLAARPVSLIVLTIADHGSLALPVPARIVMCVLLAIPAVYTFSSVARYFGVARAAGIDHFDERYRNEPLVRKGMFRSMRKFQYPPTMGWPEPAPFAKPRRLQFRGFPLVQPRPPRFGFEISSYLCTER